MSDPIRYKATSDHFFLRGPDFLYFYQAEPDEVFVKESDYARLKAEVERLRNDYDAIFQDRALIFQGLKEKSEAYERLHHLYLSAKEGKSSV